MVGEKKMQISEYTSIRRVTTATLMGGTRVGKAIRSQALAVEGKNGEKKELPPNPNNDSAYWNSKSRWTGEDGRHSPEAAKEAWASTRQKGIMEDLGVSAEEARRRDTPGK